MFYAVILTPDPLTLNVCSTSGATLYHIRAKLAIHSGVIAI